MIKGKIDGDAVNVMLKGTTVDLLTELQLLNLNVLRELTKFSNVDINQLAKDMCQILIETIEESEE